MSAGSQVSAFFPDIAKSKLFWTIQFEDGQYIKWCNEDRSEVFPLWSTKSRVEATLKRVEEFEGGKPISISLNKFLDSWLPDLTEKMWLLALIGPVKIYLVGHMKQRKSLSG